MKLRLVLLAAASLLLITSITSCRRDYTCQCEITYSGQPGLPDTLYRDYPITETKKKAKNLCEQNSRESEMDGIKTKETCYLY
ncbi:MAG: hypothetical protein K0R82_1972 [Flavipsychrobacter sp.]|jgi:hypothetical protein|nr:hypothetical protein [Flavipsychrobacter sp.]